MDFSIFPTKVGYVRNTLLLLLLLLEFLGETHIIIKITILIIIRAGTSLFSNWFSFS